MSYPPSSWQHWPPHSPPHSTKELEHRLTVLETEGEANGDKIKDHDDRLSLHEKAILAIGAILQILMQDKYPALAGWLKGLLP